MSAWDSWAGRVAFPFDSKFSHLYIICMEEWHPEVSLIHVPLIHFFRYPTEKKIWIPGHGKEDKEKGFYLEMGINKNKPGIFKKYTSGKRLEAALGKSAEKIGDIN